MGAWVIYKGFNMLTGFFQICSQQAQSQDLEAFLGPYQKKTTP